MDYKEKLKAIINSNETPFVDINTFLKYFPELKESEESENERIRRALIELVRMVDKNPIHQIFGYGGIKYSDMIAWLEKQQNPAKFDDTNAKRMFIKALERVEEQNSKGYKLTDCDKNSWWEDFKAYTSCTIEQKPAEWSADDLPEFESYLCLMFQKFRTKGVCTNGEIVDFVKEHSQKLKDTLCHPWSKEDERIYQSIMDDTVQENQLDDKQTNWLKSLKGRVGCEANCTTKTRVE